MSQPFPANACTEGGHLLVQVEEQLGGIIEVDQALAVGIQRADVLVVAELTGEDDLHLLRVRTETLITKKPIEAWTICPWIPRIQRGASRQQMPN
jgi:hypothetical protein